MIATGAANQGLSIDSEALTVWSGRQSGAGGSSASGQEQADRFGSVLANLTDQKASPILDKDPSDLLAFGNVAKAAGSAGLEDTALELQTLLTKLMGQKPTALGNANGPAAAGGPGGADGSPRLEGTAAELRTLLATLTTQRPAASTDLNLPAAAGLEGARRTDGALGLEGTAAELQALLTALTAQRPTVSADLNGLGAAAGRAGTGKTDESVGLKARSVTVEALTGSSDRSLTPSSSAAATLEPALDSSQANSDLRHLGKPDPLKAPSNTRVTPAPNSGVDPCMLSSSTAAVALPLAVATMSLPSIGPLSGSRLPPGTSDPSSAVPAGLMGVPAGGTLVQKDATVDSVKETSSLRSSGKLAASSPIRQSQKPSSAPNAGADPSVSSSTGIAPLPLAAAVENLTGDHNPAGSMVQSAPIDQYIAGSASLAQMSAAGTRAQNAFAPDSSQDVPGLLSSSKPMSLEGHQYKNVKSEPNAEAVPAASLLVTAAGAPRLATSNLSLNSMLPASGPLIRSGDDVSLPAGAARLAQQRSRAGSAGETQALPGASLESGTAAAERLRPIAAAPDLGWKADAGAPSAAGLTSALQVPDAGLAVAAAAPSRSSPDGITTGLAPTAGGSGLVRGADPQAVAAAGLASVPQGPGLGSAVAAAAPSRSSPDGITTGLAPTAGGSGLVRGADPQAVAAAGLASVPQGPGLGSAVAAAAPSRSSPDGITTGPAPTAGGSGLVRGTDPQAAAAAGLASVLQVPGLGSAAAAAAPSRSSPDGITTGPAPTAGGSGLVRGTDPQAVAAAGLASALQVPGLGSAAATAAPSRSSPDGITTGPAPMAEGSGLVRGTDSQAAAAAGLASALQVPGLGSAAATAAPSRSSPDGITTGPAPTAGGSGLVRGTDPQAAAAAGLTSALQVPAVGSAAATAAPSRSSPDGITTVVNASRPGAGVSNRASTAEASGLVRGADPYMLRRRLNCPARCRCRIPD